MGRRLGVLAAVLHAVSGSGQQPTPAAVVTLTIDNTKPRCNTSGSVMDAHDGTVAQWEPGGDWYYYAMGYGRCAQGRDRCQHGCGYGFSWVGVWRSPDLRNGTWALVREARDHSWPRWSADNSTSGIYFRPHVIYCRRTQQYVLWLSSWFAPQCPGGSQSCWMVGVSRSPEGPFEYSGAVAGRFADGGDFDLLVGRDDTAHIIYTSTAQGHRMSTERLSDDYLRPIGRGSGAGPSNSSSGLFGAGFAEAPAIFQRGSVYYAMFGKCCCFCGRGTGVGVYTSSNPLGPFTYRRNIGCGKPKRFASAEKKSAVKPSVGTRRQPAAARLRLRHGRGSPAQLPEPLRELHDAGTAERSFPRPNNIRRGLDLDGRPLAKLAERYQGRGQAVLGTASVRIRRPGSAGVATALGVGGLLRAHDALAATTTVPAGARAGRFSSSHVGGPTEDAMTKALFERL